VRASIKISDAGVGPISIAVVLLAVLLSGFFWLGYWVSDTNLAENPRPEGPQIIQIPLPNVEIVPETIPTPTQLLKISPEEKVRL
jgi:hypothetical protein